MSFSVLPLWMLIQKKKINYFFGNIILKNVHIFIYHNHKCNVVMVVESMIEYSIGYKGYASKLEISL